MREYLEEYVATGANYFVCSFQWDDLTHAHAARVETCRRPSGKTVRR